MQAKQIELIVGLGNPGEKYKNTRHNLGFLFIDRLAKQLKAPDLKYEKQTLSETSESSYKIKARSYKLVLAKPQAFMNKSGSAVLLLAKRFRTKSENILIVHDDIDILWGKFKFSFGRSSAGHKGVESIIKALKTKNFWRLRIGIQPTLKKHTPADKIILKKFTPAELNTLNQTMKKARSRFD